MSHLCSGPINIGALREFYRRDFLNILNKAKGPKSLVWDSRLMTPLGLIAEFSWLKEHEVDQMFTIKNNEIPASPASSRSVFFLILPDLKLMSILDSYLGKEYHRGNRDKEYYIMFVPRRSLVCENYLEEKKALAKFKSIEEFSLDLLPLDYDVLSMEQPECFADFTLRNNQSSLHQLARGLMTLQAIYGIIPRIQGKGEKAKRLCGMLTRMRQESTMDETLTPPRIDNMILIDRRIDPLTPLLNQLTYEGLIDEKFGIEYAISKIPADILEDQSGNEFRKIPLNSTDELFTELRDRNFATVGSVISRRAKEVSAEVSESKAARDLSVLRKVVSNIPIVKQRTAALALHTPIAEVLNSWTNTDEFMDSLHCQQDFLNDIETDKAHPYIEECISQEDDIIKVLRLICIQSYCNNGLKLKLLEYYKREILQVYGIEQAFTLENLESVGLLTVQTSSSGWRPAYATLKKTLQLVGDPAKDMSGLYSGYAPLSCRLVQFLTRPGWRTIAEALNLLPGPEVDVVQHLPPALHNPDQDSLDRMLPTRKITVVVFIGGVTASEISALRLLSQMDDGESVIRTDPGHVHVRHVVAKLRSS